MKCFCYLMIVILTNSVLAQDITNKLGASGNYDVTDSSDNLLLRLRTDNGLLINGTFGTGVIPATGSGSRLMWYPAKAAFRIGYVSGTQWNDTNIGDYSVAMGRESTASGSDSFVANRDNTASGSSSFAGGRSCTAGGQRSMAFGYGASTSGTPSFSFGAYTSATGTSSIATGTRTTASGYSSSAMGAYTTASGDSSTAMGAYSTAEGLSSTAMGGHSIANAQYSTAMGYGTTASGSYSTATGRTTTASGSDSFAANRDNTASGSSSFAGGRSCTAGGQRSMAFGYGASTSGTPSFSFGAYTSATGASSIATGTRTTASGDNTTAMGSYVSTNSNAGSFIIGDNSTTVNTSCTSINQMVARFANGYTFYTNSSATLGATLPANGSSWAAPSDSTKKENFKQADGEYFLNSIKKLKLGSWNYKAQDSSIRHYGPMAQEIFNYFGKDDFGTIGNDTTLATADMDGIMLIAIQALINKNAELENEISELKQKILKVKATKD